MDHSVPLTGGVAISHGRNQRGGLAAAPIPIPASIHPVERSVVLIVALIVALTVALTVAAAPGADFELGMIAGPATRTGV